jgi:hypothetical protein
MNKIRSFLFTFKVNKNLWGEALLAVTFIYNKTPHKALNYKSLYKIYYKKEPNIQYIKIWRSLIYYNTNKQFKKLEPIQRKRILIGFSDYKYYKIYNIQN